MFYITQLGSVIMDLFVQKIFSFIFFLQRQMERVTVVGVTGNVEGVFDFLFDSITRLSLNEVNVNICVSCDTPARRQTLSFTTSLSFSNWNYMHRKKTVSCFFSHSIERWSQKIKRAKTCTRSFEAHLYLWI